MTNNRVEKTLVKSFFDRYKRMVDKSERDAMEILIEWLKLADIMFYKIPLEERITKAKEISSKETIELLESIEQVLLVKE